MSVLNLRSANLLKVPHKILWDQTKLIVIDLQRNRLRELPHEICDLPLLKQLQLDHNELIVLPHNLGRLRYLEILSASHNQLSDIPSSFFTTMGSCSQRSVRRSV